MAYIENLSWGPWYGASGTGRRVGITLGADIPATVTADTASIEVYEVAAYLDGTGWVTNEVLDTFMYGDLGSYSQLDMVLVDTEATPWIEESNWRWQQLWDGYNGYANILPVSIPLTYGAAKTVNYTYDVRLGSGTGYRVIVPGTISLPARPYYLPAAPTGLSAARASDYQANLAWTISSPAHAVVQNVYVYRSTNDASFVHIATLGAVSSWSDTTIQPNRKYRYVVATANSSGSSGWSVEAPVPVLTTPAGATSVNSVKSGSNIVTTWVNNVSYSYGIKIDIYHSESGGAMALLSSNWAPGTTSYTHVGANPATTHQYAVLTRETNAGLYTSGYGPTISLLVAPASPTVTLPSVQDLASPLVVNWVHNPLDTTPQTSAHVQYREVTTPTPAWTVQTVTTATSYSITGLANGKSYEVQVQTKGDHASYSPYSSSLVVIGSTPPLATITSPAAGSLGTSVLNATWGYYDAQGTAQTAWRTRLLQGAVVVEDYSENGTGGSRSFTNLLNNTAYTLEVLVKDGSGLWSVAATAAYTTDFLLPTTATVTGVLDSLTGSIQLTIVEPLPDGTEVEAVSYSIQRFDTEWSTILSSAPCPEAPATVGFTDPVPALIPGVRYRIINRSATPTESISDEAVVDASGGSWIYLNAGPGWSIMSRLRVSSRIAATIARYKELYVFEGRQKALEFTGMEISRGVQLSGQVATFATDPRLGLRGTWPGFVAIAEEPAPICYRDPLGRKLFCSIGPVSVDHDASTDLTSVSASLSEVDEIDEY